MVYVLLHDAYNPVKWIAKEGEAVVQVIKKSVFVEAEMAVIGT